MSRPSLLLSLTPFLLPLLWSVSVQGAPATAGDAKAGAAKATACASCHGAQGISAVPTFPNLGGLPAAYTHDQLTAYKNGTRKDPMMNPQASPLSEQDMDNLAAYYASLPAKPAGHPDASSRGGTLYLKGDSSQGIPACQGCHGPAGDGGAAGSSMASYPRVAGQPEAYLAKTLAAYKIGANGSNAHAKVMEGVMKNISNADIQALAGFIAKQ